MKVLIVGSGKGSFEIRIKQLGAALGARVTSLPTESDFAWADVAILVKHAGTCYAPTARKHHCAVVWDALDFWRQPDQNALPELVARQQLSNHLAAVRADLVIGATEAMAQEAGGVYLPHHCWDGLTPTPARESIQVVAYEGKELYLGRWADWIREVCVARGWTFVLNPPDLREADLLVAFRDGPWDGWMCREWKSGVKIVNAIAAGRPIITQPSAAWRDLQADGALIEERHGLDQAFDILSSHAARAAFVTRAATLAPSYTCAAIAARYTTILERVLCPA